MTTNDQVTELRAAYADLTNMESANPHAEDNCNLYGHGFLAAKTKALAIMHTAIFATERAATQQAGFGAMRFDWTTEGMEQSSDGAFCYAPDLAAPISEDTDELPITRSTFGTKEECEAEHARRAARTPASVGSEAKGEAKGVSEDTARAQFEAQASDSYGFKRSRKGTYVNTSVARDWKWFKLGIAAAPERSGKAADSYAATAADWSEDFPHENGNYENRCSNCGIGFMGHKRRSICKVCAPAGNSSAAPSAPFEAAATGLRYNSPGACGEVAAIHIGGVRYPVAAPAPTGESVSVPEGMQLVPISPTIEMQNAAGQEFVKAHGLGKTFPTAHAIYTAMLAAAPKFAAKESAPTGGSLGVPDHKIFSVIDSMGWALDDIEKDEMHRLCTAMLAAAKESA